MAAELHEMLREATIRPPYTVVTLPYGAVTREFLARCPPGDVVGMVFVDANQETMHMKIDIPFKALKTIDAELDVAEISGFVDELNRSLTPGEYEEVMRSGNGGSPGTAAAEMDHLLSSCAALGEKRQLEKQARSQYPVAVIRANSDRDWAKMSDAACARSVGTAEERAEVEALVGRIRAFDEDFATGGLALVERWALRADKEQW